MPKNAAWYIGNENLRRFGGSVFQVDRNLESRLADAGNYKFEMWGTPAVWKPSAAVTKSGRSRVCRLIRRN